MHSHKQFKSAVSDHKIDASKSVITMLYDLKNDDKTNISLLIESNNKRIKKYELKINDNTKANLVVSEILDDQQLDCLINPSNYIKITFDMASQRAEKFEKKMAKFQFQQSNLDSLRFSKTFPKKTSIFSSSAHDCDDDFIRMTSYEWIKKQLLDVDDTLTKLLPEDIEVYAKTHQPEITCSIL